MQDPKWNALEVAFDSYKKANFLDISVKRINEFETIWEVAHSEGGKYHLQAFWSQLEDGAMNIND